MTGQKSGQSVSHGRRIDYSGLAFPKGTPKATTKARAGRRRATTKADVKRTVFARDVTCRAYGVSPICRKTPRDRHELIPVGVGGQVTTGNAVAICGPDHRACQNALGGRRLAFVWPGQGKGRPPDADRPGDVLAVWRGIWRGVGAHGVPTGASGLVTKRPTELATKRADRITRDPSLLTEVFRREAEMDATSYLSKRDQGIYSRKDATTIEIFQGNDGAWYFRAKARNRQTGTISEGYTRKAGAIRAATRWHPGIPQVIIETTSVPLTSGTK